MLSTQNEKNQLISEHCISQILKNGNIRHFWTNSGQIPNPINEGLVLCNTLIESIDEAKNNPWKLQEQCYINNTMKIALGLSANQMIVLGAIYGVTHDSGVGYLTNEYISNATGLSKRTIIYFLKKFEKLGLIERKYKRNGMKVTRNYSFTEIFFKVSELSGNKCIKRPEAKPEDNECQNLHEMATKPIGTQVQKLHINNTSSTIIDNNIPQSILLSNKVNINIKVNTEYSELKQKVDKKQKTKSTQKTKLSTHKFPWPSYNKLIDNYVDSHYKDGQEILKVLWKTRLQVLYGINKNKNNRLIKNQELLKHLEYVYKTSKGNACESMAMIAYSNKQYYKKEYKPNVKTSIAFRDKLYSFLIKNVDRINSKLDEDDPRYEKNLELKYKALDKLSTWYRVENNLPTFWNNEYTSTQNYIETPGLNKKRKFDNETFYTDTNEMLKNFIDVNKEEKQWTFEMAEQNKKIGDNLNCQGVGVPLYNLDGSQKINFVSHLKDNNTSNGVESYGYPKAKYDSSPTYDLNKYNDYYSYNFNSLLYKDSIETKEAYGNTKETAICNEGPMQVTLNNPETYIKNRVTPPPRSAAPPSPCERECIIRSKLSDLRGVNEEKCKSIPPDNKQALNGLKTAKNENGPTYDLERYEKFDIFDYFNNEEDEGLCAYNPESTKELRYIEELETEEKTKFEVETKETPPPIFASSSSTHVNEHIKRGDLVGKQRAKIKKCKSNPPGTKQALNELKTALNEKCEKSEEQDPEFVKKCLEIAKANLMRKDE